MRQILQVWQQFQNEIVETVKEAPRTVNVLGVRVSNDSEATEKKNWAEKAIQRFKSTKKRFAGSVDRYVILQNQFLENMLISPIRTLRLEHMNAGGQTFLYLGKEMLEDIRVQKSLGSVITKKTFKQVVNEQKLNKSMNSFIAWMFSAIVFLGLFCYSLLLHWLFPEVLFFGLVTTASISYLRGKAVFSERKKFQKDYLRAKNNYKHLLSPALQRKNIFHNGTDDWHKSISGNSIQVQCRFLDFEKNDDESQLKKDVLEHAAQLAESMDGKVFFLIEPNTETLDLNFYQGKAGFIFAFHIAEVGIRLKETTIFLRDWPAKDPDFAEGFALKHAKKVAGDNPLELFIDNNPF